MEEEQGERISDKLNIGFTPQDGGAIRKVAPDIQAIEGGKPIDDLDLKKDYLTVRKNLREILMSGSDALDGVLTVAKESDSPRAYEVAAQLIKAVSDVNKDLLEVHKKIKEIEGESESKKATSITNNSIFVGSTRELQALLKNKAKETKEIVDTQIVEAEGDGQTG